MEHTNVGIFSCRFIAPLISLLAKSLLSFCHTPIPINVLYVCVYVWATTIWHVQILEIRCCLNLAYLERFLTRSVNFQDRDNSRPTYDSSQCKTEKPNKGGINNE